MSKKNRRDGIEVKEEMIVQKNKPVEPVPVEVPEAVEFDIWWVMRSDAIPKHHMKEVIKADFKGRGLSMMETVETFDKALKAYGL